MMMWTQFHRCMKVAAIGCALVLLTSGTARLFHISKIPDHKHAKAVSEASSFVSDHVQDAAASRGLALPFLEIREPGTTPKKALAAGVRPLLRPLSGRAPPAWS